MASFENAVPFSAPAFPPFFPPFLFPSSHSRPCQIVLQHNVTSSAKNKLCSKSHWFVLFFQMPFLTNRCFSCRWHLSRACKCADYSLPCSPLKHLLITERCLIWLGSLTPKNSFFTNSTCSSIVPFSVRFVFPNSLPPPLRRMRCHW